MACMAGLRERRCYMHVSVELSPPNIAIAARQTILRPEEKSTNGR